MNSKTQKELVDLFNKFTNNAWEISEVVKFEDSDIINLKTHLKGSDGPDEEFYFSFSSETKKWVIINC